MSLTPCSVSLGSNPRPCTIDPATALLLLLLLLLLLGWLTKGSQEGKGAEERHKKETALLLLFTS